MEMRLATATWADPALVEEKFLYHDGDGSVWLGRSANERQSPLGFKDDRHVCLVCGTRGGKGVSSIITNLCLWPGSLLVIDPKGENTTITAARRGTGSEQCEGLGQAVHVLDPFKAATVPENYRSRFNPLDALDPDDDESIDGAALIADALVVIHEDSKDPFWEESARELVKGLIMHVLTAPEYEGRRNLVTLRKLITGGDWEAVEALRASGETDIPSAHGLLWMAVAKNPAMGGVVGDVGKSILDMFYEDSRVYQSVLQSANRNTEFIDSPGMRHCLETSDFQLGDLKTKPKGVSLYLCLPQRFMDSHYRWLRMMIGLTVSEMEKVKGQPATGHRVLMVLDEFAGLKRMKAIETGVAQMAGHGMKMFFVVQGLPQLHDLYKDNWETFLANSGLKLFFNLDDNFSRDYVCKLIGETEVIRQVHSSGDSSSVSDSASESTSTGRSESVGDSASHGRSVSEGTSTSSGQSYSHGVNKSSGKSYGGSISATSSNQWSPNSFFGKQSSCTVSESSSTSSSEGTSEGWSRSATAGASRGSSETSTYGSSRTSGVSESETSGMTHGTSQGRTSGTSETFHRRPLVAPHEIGLYFARIDDKKHKAYPGLGLAIVAGQPAIAFRRVNYYEDVQFIRRFQPHPEYKFVPPFEDEIDADDLAEYRKQIPGLYWRPSIGAGAVVRAGDIIALAYGSGDKMIAPILAPCAARVKSIPLELPGFLPNKNPLLALLEVKNPLASVFAKGMKPCFGGFTILHFVNDDEGTPVHPFGALAAHCKMMRTISDTIEAARLRKQEEDEKARKKALLRKRAKRAQEIQEARRKWLRLSGMAGLILLVDIGITALTHSVAGIVIGIGVFAGLCVCGVKVLRTLADDMDNEEPPKALPATEKRPLFDPELRAAVEEEMKEREAEKAAKNQAAKKAPEKRQEPVKFQDFLFKPKWNSEEERLTFEKIMKEFGNKK